MTATKGLKPDFTVIDAFHAMHAGVKVRVYPGTGRQVDPADLRSPVTWEGDSIGCGKNELVDLTDQDGNWATVPADAILTHEVWGRIDSYGQMRIKGGLGSGGAS